MATESVGEVCIDVVVAVWRGLLVGIIQMENADLLRATEDQGFIWEKVIERVFGEGGANGVDGFVLG